MAPNNNYNNKGNFSQNRNNNGNKGYQNHNNGSAKKEAQSVPYKQLSDLNYVDTAEEVVKTLERDNKDKIKLTTSQIRNLLAMTSEILNKINSSKSAEETNPEISPAIVQYLNSFKIRSVYECGRTPSVKDFINKAHILEHLKEIKTMNDCELFCHYMEALVAYHRYQGGKD
ncbi:type III-A CRISPR-associated protein Csm2 [uncultured Succinivibrio sp.]|uniref:type III-A CRISPR-associated protein Csm2 n=1 Tax=uncultured Succinivibrio sp. TaxID=540749 RepID=UPI0025EE3E46|nr:type III-A CRISPR-associated protein Csm2 [uncultured Succinivibrio sp.]